MTQLSPASAAGSSGIWRLVLLPPVIVTWAVLLIRLGGELVQGPTWLFSRHQGGGLAVVGISWLMVVFGAYFGWRLAKAGRGPDRPGMAVFVHILAIAAATGGLYGLHEAGIFDPTKLSLTNAYCFAGAYGTASLLMLWSWPALFLANVLYAFLARLAVIAVTIPATLYAWDTHFSKMGQEGLEEATWAHVVGLSTAQVCFWIPLTVLVGGLFGSIAGLIAGGGRAASVQPHQAGAAGVIAGGDV